MAAVYIARDCDSDSLRGKERPVAEALEAIDDNSGSWSTKKNDERSRRRQSVCDREAKKCHENPLQWFRIESNTIYLCTVLIDSLIFVHWNAIAGNRRWNEIYINWISRAPAQINQKPFEMHSCIPWAVGTLAVAPATWLSENVCLTVHSQHTAHPDRNRIFFLCFYLKRNSEMHLRTRTKLFRFILLTPMHPLRTRKPNGEQQPAGIEGRSKLIKNIQKAILKFFNTEPAKHGKTNWFLHCFFSFFFFVFRSLCVADQIVVCAAFSHVQSGFPHQFLFFMFL